MKNIAIIFLSGLCVWLSFLTVVERTKYANAHAKDWYPRLSWKEFMKEQNCEEEITHIYIKNGLLHVGTQDRTFPHIIEIH